MPAAGSSALWLAGLKAALFTLLACNTAIYLVTGEPGQALDSTAWLTLLALFELENRLERDARPWIARIIRAIRLAATLAVGAAAMIYAYENEWLDAINSALWIAVVLLLEFEVRFPAAVANQRLQFVAATSALYAALAALVLAWAWRGEWFDAYDAALWIAAFALIEMDVLRLFSREAAMPDCSA